MDSEMTGTPGAEETAGTSRRDFIKRAGKVGVAAAYVVPAIQVVNMASASAGTTPSVPTTEPPPNTFPSYVALNVTCILGDGPMQYVIKWEDGDDSTTWNWDNAPGNFPGCDNFTPYGTKADGGALGFTAASNYAGGYVAITVPEGCTVDGAVVKKGQTCCYGAPAGAGPTTLNYFCEK